jgi:phosphonate transport system substrate-binding protein
MAFRSIARGAKMVAMLTLASYLADNARPVYERLAAWLGGRLGEPASLLAGVEWGERVRRLDEGRVHVGFICGLPYSQRVDRVELLCAPVMAHHRYGGRPVYFTDVIVRRDGSLAAFADLRGRSYAYNDAGSNSGYVVPRDHLLRLGETRGYFGSVVASGSHQCSIGMVLKGEVDASGIDSTVLELEMAHDARIEPAIRTVQTIGPFPVPPVVVARGLPEARKARLRELFLGMHADAEGRDVLAAGLIARFVPVRDSDYDPIRELVRRAEAAGFRELR